MPTRPFSSEPLPHICYPSFVMPSHPLPHWILIFSCFQILESAVSSCFFLLTCEMFLKNQLKL